MRKVTELIFHRLTARTVTVLEVLHLHLDLARVKKDTPATGEVRLVNLDGQILGMVNSQPYSKNLVVVPGVVIWLVPSLT